MTEAVIWKLVLLRKSMDWFLYDNGPRHEKVNFEHCSVVSIVAFEQVHNSLGIWRISY